MLVIKFISLFLFGVRGIRDDFKMSPPAGQDVNDGWSFQHPELYVPGQLNLYFSKRAFFKCVLHGAYSSLVLFFIPYAALHDTMRDDGRDTADYQSFAVLTQTCLLFTVSIQVCRLFPVSIVYVHRI